MGYLDSLESDYESQLKDLKNYWSGRGLMGSSFYQDPYDALTEKYNNYKDERNQAFLRADKEYRNYESRGQLPWQIQQRQEGEAKQAKIEAAIQADQARSIAAKLAPVQQGIQPVSMKKIYNDLNSWIFKYIPANETVPHGWH